MILLSAEILYRIKTSGEYTGNDVPVSRNKLAFLKPGVSADILIDSILALEDIKIDDRGLIIPKIYFE